MDTFSIWLYFSYLSRFIQILFGIVMSDFLFMFQSLNPKSKKSYLPHKNYEMLCKTAIFAERID